MAKKRTPEVKLAELIRDMGIEKAETYFQFLKALNTLKTDPKPRKKAKLGPHDLELIDRAKQATGLY